MQHKNQLWWEAKDSIPQTGGSSFSRRIIPPCRKIRLSGPDKHFYCLIRSTCWNSNLRDISPETIKGATKLHWFYISYKLHLYHCVSVNSGNPLADVSEELHPEPLSSTHLESILDHFISTGRFLKTGGFLLCSKKVDMSTVRRCQEQGSDITFTLRACWPTRMLKKVITDQIPAATRPTGSCPYRTLSAVWSVSWRSDLRGLLCSSVYWNSIIIIVHLCLNTRRRPEESPVHNYENIALCERSRQRCVLCTLKLCFWTSSTWKLVFESAL